MHFRTLSSFAIGISQNMRSAPVSDTVHQVVALSHAVQAVGAALCCELIYFNRPVRKDGLEGSVHLASCGEAALSPASGPSSAPRIVSAQTPYTCTHIQDMKSSDSSQCITT